MIYLLVGENSYRALKKIADIKSAFYKKGGQNLAVEEVDGSDASMEKILESICAGNLFAPRRLVVLKHSIEIHSRIINSIKERGEELSASKDVFIFWERNFTENEDALTFFKKNAEKIEETGQRSQDELDRWLQKEAIARGIQLNGMGRNTMIERQLLSGEVSPEWSLLQELERMALGAGEEYSTRQQKIEPAQNRIFSLADSVFANAFSRGLISFRQAKKEGIDEADLARMFLWKLKNIFLVKNGESKKLNPYVAQKTAVDAGPFSDGAVLDSFWEGVLADSAHKRDSKNTDEHIESFILSMKKRV